MATSRQNENSQTSAQNEKGLSLQSPQHQINKADKRTSEKKREANRKNAKKSTGPNTSRGKSISRTNATKHGFFANPARASCTAGENPRAYKDLLEDLQERYQPIGKAEEVEVEKLARLYWKLKRITRYEDFMTQRAQDEALDDAVKRFAPFHDVSKLEEIEEEIERTGEVPNDLKESVVTGDSLLRCLWENFDAEENCLSLSESTSSEYIRLRSLSIISRMRSYLEKESKRMFSFAQKFAVGENILPPVDSEDRIFLHEAATERGIDRAMDRLERLQRGRMMISYRSGSEQTDAEL